MFYDIIIFMEINEVIAKNLIAYRKQKGLTQAELAETINYSDKSISKWERGECLPDVAILKQLADFYGITVNDFLTESGDVKVVKQKRKFLRKKIMVPLLSIGVVWLVTIIAFVCLSIFAPTIDRKWLWLLFVYAVPVSAIVAIVFASIWKEKITNFIAITTLIWTITASVFLSVTYVPNLWSLFLIPAVLQVLLIWWFWLKADFREKFKFSAKNKKQKRDEKKSNKNINTEENKK